MGINFRTKIFILFVIFTIFFRVFYASYIDGFSFERLIAVLFSVKGIILLASYGLAILFLLKDKAWAWLIAIIPSLWLLFDPTKVEGSPLVKGLFFYFTQAVVNQAPQEIISALFQMIFPIVVIIYCLLNFGTKLGDYEERKLDTWAGWIFLIITAIGFIGILELWVYGGLSLRFLFRYPPTYISLIYIGLAVFWQIKSPRTSKVMP